MKRAIAVVAFCTVSLLVGSAVADDSKKLQDNRQELNRIKRQLTETQRKVDSLKTMESDLQQTVRRYGDRVTRNRQQVAELEGKLQTVRGQLTTNATLLADRTDRLQRRRDNYASLLVDFYHKRYSSTGFGNWDFGSYLAQGRRIQYLGAVSGRSGEEITRVKDSLRTLTASANQLKHVGSDLRRLRAQKKAKLSLDMTLKKKEESNLGTVRRQTGLLQERLASLSEAARQMEDIIARLEKAQQERRQVEGTVKRFQSGSFAQFKGSLAPPIRGKIISSFGWKTDAITNLKSFSPGIDIKPQPNQKTVAASAPGRVAYIGTLRGYDNFVILEHDDGYFTTYAGLSRITVEQNELIDTGEQVGFCGGSPVHFEIRLGREHLDPAVWLDMNGF